MRIAALDLGSNTFLCLIADVAPSPSGQPLFEKIWCDEVRMVRLGQGVSQTKSFHPEALMRADAALREFKEHIDQFQPEVILAMATSAARDVTNQSALFSLAEKYGIPIEIIPGDKEAEITYSGAVSSQTADDDVLVVDVGGGSTEIIRGQGPHLSWGQSLDLGCVRLKEAIRLDGVLSSHQQNEARTQIWNELKNLKHPVKGITNILAVAGTPTELARMELGVYDPSKIDSHHFTTAGLEEWIQRLAPLTAEEIHQTYQVPKGRADVLILGLLILSEVTKFFGQTKLGVSTRGVRYGVALTAFARSQAAKGIG